MATATRIAERASARRLRVAILSHGRTHLCDLARELDALGHEVAFYSLVPSWRTRRFGLPDRCNRWLAPLIAPLVAAERLATGTRGAPIANRAMTAALDALAARVIDRCDLFIGMSGMSVRSVRSAQRRFGARIFVERGSSHILTQQEILQRLPHRRDAPPRVADYSIRRELEEYQLADRIVVPSSHVVSSFVERGVSPSRLFRNMYGVDLRMFAPTPPPPGPPCILSVGAWSLHKGCDILHEAWRRLPGVRLVHVGTVRDAPLPREPGFEYHPAVDAWMLPQFYGRGHVLALASHDEGFSLVLLQAIACGLSIVASDRTGAADLRELLQNPSLVTVVPAADATALAEALREALARATSQRGTRDLLGQNRQELSWAAYGRRYDQVLQQ